MHTSGVSAFSLNPSPLTLLPGSLQIAGILEQPVRINQIKPAAFVCAHATYWLWRYFQRSLGFLMSVCSYGMTCLSWQTASVSNHLKWGWRSGSGSRSTSKWLIKRRVGFLSDKTVRKHDHRPQCVYHAPLPLITTYLSIHLACTYCKRSALSNLCHYLPSYYTALTLVLKNVTHEKDECNDSPAVFLPSYWWSFESSWWIFALLLL